MPVKWTHKDINDKIQQAISPNSSMVNQLKMAGQALKARLPKAG